MAYFPLKAKSECVAPADASLGGVVEIIRIFQAACPASHRPALRPTRGSGLGAVAETIGVTGGGITAGGGGGGVGRAPALAGGFAFCAPSAGVAGCWPGVDGEVDCGACGAAIVFGTNHSTTNMTTSNFETSATNFINTPYKRIGQLTADGPP